MQHQLTASRRHERMDSSGKAHVDPTVAFGQQKCVAHPSVVSLSGVLRLSTNAICSAKGRRLQVPHKSGPVARGPCGWPEIGLPSLSSESPCKPAGEHEEALGWGALGAHCLVLRTGRCAWVP